MSYAPHEKHAKCERKEKPVIDYSKFLFFDGAMGTMLQKSGLQAGELPELLNLTSPETILSIHKEYVNAGADIITSNTFGANRHKMKDSETVKKVIKSGIDIAKKSGAKYVALDIGPTGAMLKPIGTMEFDTAYDIFKEQVLAGSESRYYFNRNNVRLTRNESRRACRKRKLQSPCFCDYDLYR